MRKLLTFAALAVLTLVSARAERTVTFAFSDEAWLTEAGIAVPNPSEGTNLDDSFVYDGITFAQTKGTTATRVWNASGTLALRAYRGGSITLSGATFYQITISANVPASLSTTVGTYAGGIWTGEETEVTFSVDANIQISTITVVVDNGVPTPGLPSFSPGGGMVTKGTVVTISCQKAHKIYYTTDGSIPTNASTVYNGPITINESVTLKAIGYASDNATTGDVATATYNIVPTPKTPVFTPGGGEVPKGTEVSISCESATYIYYTTDGSTPSKAATRYTGPIAINEALTLKAIGYGSDNVTFGSVATAYYTLTNDGHTSDDYQLVTDPATLKAGDKIIIVHTANAAAMATTQNASNRAATTITISDDVATVNSDTEIITLEGSAGRWHLKTSLGYLFAASSAANWLRTESAPDADGNANASIALVDGVMTIVFQGTNTRNQLLYNSSSNGGNIFSCYTATSNAVKNVNIYRQFVGSETTVVAVNGLAEMNEQPEGTLVRLLLPDDEQHVTRVIHADGTDVYVRDLDGSAAVFTGLTPNKPMAHNQHLLGYITGTTGRTDDGMPTLDCSADITNTAMLVIADPVTEPDVKPTRITIDDCDNHLADWVTVKSLVVSSDYSFTNQFGIENWKAPFTGALVDLNAIVAGNSTFYPFATDGYKPITYLISELIVNTPIDDYVSVDVKVDRSMKADEWTTLVLPFNLKNFNGQVMKLASIEQDTDNNAMMIFEEANQMLAGVPYLVKPAENLTEIIRDDVTFSSARPVADTGQAAADTHAKQRIGTNAVSDRFALVGTYEPLTLPTDGSARVVSAEGLAVNADDLNNEINATYAYITAPANATVSLWLNEGTTGVITNLADLDGDSAQHATYNVLGQRIYRPFDQLPAGVYIMNGHKVVKQ